MCADCRYWLTREAFEDHGLRFAPCALRPDRVVTDKRVPGGKVLQAYATQDTYACAKFERPE